MTPMLEEGNQLIEFSDVRVEDKQKTLAAGEKKQGWSAIGANTNTVPDLLNKSKIDQLEEKKERRSGKKTTSFPQAIRDRGI